MNSEELRKLKVGDRVCWDGSAKNQGLICETSCSGVTVKWNDGQTSAINHNDMDRISKVFAR